MQILTTAQVKVTTHCLIYGPAKTGKTRLAPTAPNPIICDADAGLASIREYNLPYVAVTNYTEFQEFMRWVHGANEARQFETIIIDDLTEIAEMFLKAEKPKHKNTMQAYGQLNDEMMDFVRKFRMIPQPNGVLICKEERIKDERTGGMIYSPMIPGKAVAPALPYLLGEFYRMEQYTDPQTGAVHPVLRTKRDAANQYDAGSRAGKLGEIEFAHLGNIFQKVMS